MERSKGLDLDDASKKFGAINAECLKFSFTRRLINIWIKNKILITDFIAVSFCLIYILAASLVSLHRFWQYEVFYYDFGIFDTAIWNVSRFKAPIIDHLEVGGKLIFADHFNPSIFLLSPLYWFISKSEIILIAQAVIVGLSGLVLYFIGREVLKNKFISLAVSISYLLFIGLQNAIITDFHEVTVMTLPLMLTFWSIVKKNKLAFFIFFLLTLGFKESTSLLGIGLGILIILTHKDWLRIGFLTIIISVAWGLLTTQVVIPFFANRPYLYSPSLPGGPVAIIQALFDNSLKRRTIFYSLSSFGFLPLFYPPGWILIIGDLLVRFVPRFSDLRWDLGLHYSAQLAPILGFSTVMALSKLQKIRWLAKYIFLVAAILVFNSLYLHQFKLHGPLGLSYNPAFYRHTKNFKFLDSLISQIPKGASVMAPNNLAVRFIHTNPTWILRETYNDLAPQYIVFDARVGQNPNNFFGFQKIENVLPFLLKDPNYQLIYHRNDQFVFRRNK